MLVTLPLYFMRELGKALGLSLLLYTFMMLGMTSGQLINDGVGVTTVLSLLPNMFPLVSSFVLPFSVITGILICYGKLANGNEFVASQASGVHPIWLAAPALVVAALSSLICLYLNADVLTDAVVGIEQRVFKDRSSIIEGQLKRPGSFTYPLSKGDETHKSLTICRLPSSWMGPDKSGIDVASFVWYRKASPDTKSRWDTKYPIPTERYLAKRHEIGVTEDKKLKTLVMQSTLEEFLYLTLDSDNFDRFTSKRAQLNYALQASNVEIHIVHDRIQYWGIDKLIASRRTLMEPYNKIKDSFDDETRALAPRLLSVAEKRIEIVTTDPSLAMHKEKLDALLESKEMVDDKLGAAPYILFEALHKLHVAIRASEGALPGDVQQLYNACKGYYEVYQQSTVGVRRIKAELHTKLAYSFGCIAFACIGIPFGLMTGRDSKILGFAVGFIFGGAYILTILMLQRQVYDGIFSWFVLWIPAVVLVGIGTALWIRIMHNMK